MLKSKSRKKRKDKRKSSPPQLVVSRKHSDCSDSLLSEYSDKRSRIVSNPSNYGRIFGNNTSNQGQIEGRYNEISIPYEEYLNLLKQNEINGHYSHNTSAEEQNLKLFTSGDHHVNEFNIGVFPYSTNTLYTLGHDNQRFNTRRNLNQRSFFGNMNHTTVDASVKHEFNIESMPYKHIPRNFASREKCFSS